MVVNSKASVIFLLFECSVICIGCVVCGVCVVRVWFEWVRLLFDCCFTETFEGKLLMRLLFPLNVLIRAVS